MLLKGCNQGAGIHGPGSRHRHSATSLPDALQSKNQEATDARERWWWSRGPSSKEALTSAEEPLPPGHFGSWAMELGPGDNRQDWAQAVWAPECFHPSSGSQHPTPPTGPSGVCGADPQGRRQRPALRSCGACCLHGRICAKEGEEGCPGCPLRRTGQRSLTDCRRPPSPFSMELPDSQPRAGTARGVHFAQ